jgi:ubiquitin C-terminal hydrolase
MPSGLANQTGVCYANAVLQCLAMLIDPSQLGSMIGKRLIWDSSSWKSGLDMTSSQRIDERLRLTALEHINPTEEFIDLLRLMRNSSTLVVYPYHFQASLAIKGGESGKEFASDGGAYPFSWLKFLLNSICEGVDFNGDAAVASHPSIDDLWKVHHVYSYICVHCTATRTTLSALDAKDWGLCLDPKGLSNPLRASDVSVTVQELLADWQASTESTNNECANCAGHVNLRRKWLGLVSSPRLLTVEIKTYTRTIMRHGKSRYKFFFSNIILSDRIEVPLHGVAFPAVYTLQAVIKLEGKGHEHAVAYVRSKGATWWRCSDEDITPCTFGSVQTIHGPSQISLIFYRRT